MSAPSNLLLTALRHPESTLSLGLEGWDLLVRQGRRADLLARLCILIREEGLIDEVPPQARNHLESEIMLAEAHERSVRWEGFQIRRSLEDLDIPVILLKGAAYVLGELPAGHGRLFYDVDILVPKSKLDAVELQLALHGWTQGHLDAYDQRYYRQFSHQLPPLRHVKRNTVLDVHHTILPVTARLTPDPDKLIADAQPLNGHGCLKILSRTDLLLHSATHLFYEGEFGHGLRDLVDLDILLRYFGRDEAFWPRLSVRARELDLTRPLYYALLYTHSILGTPVPRNVEENSCNERPGVLAQAVADSLFSHALTPDHPSCESRFTGLARWLLYVRGHALRMPMHLLIPHLIRKAVKRRKDA